MAQRGAGKYGAESDEDDALPPMPGDDRQSQKPPAANVARHRDDDDDIVKPIGAMASKAPPQTKKGLQLAAGSHREEETRSKKQANTNLKQAPGTAASAGRATKPGPVAVAGNSTSAQQYANRVAAKTKENNRVALAPGEFISSLGKPKREDKQAIRDKKRASDPYNGRPTRPGSVSVQGSDDRADRENAKIRKSGSDTVEMAPGEHSDAQMRRSEREAAQRRSDLAEKQNANQGRSHAITDRAREVKMQQSDKVEMPPGEYSEDEMRRSDKEAAQRKSDLAEKQMAKQLAGGVSDEKDAAKRASDYTEVDDKTRASTTSTGTRRSNRTSRGSRAREEDDVGVADQSSEEEDEDMVPGARAVAGLRASQLDEDEFDPTSSAMDGELPNVVGEVSNDPALRGLVEALPVEEGDDEEEIVEEEELDEEALKNVVLAQEVDEEELKTDTNGWLARNKLFAGLLAFLVCGAIVVVAVLATGGDNTVPGGEEPEGPPTVTEQISREDEALRQESERFRVAYSTLINFTSPDLTLFDKTTPQHLALKWIADEDPAELDFTMVGSDLTAQRYGLAVLYFAASGDEWDTSSDFLGATNECGWATIEVSGQQTDVTSCNDAGFVTALRLPFANLNGTIPDEISILSSLELLDMGNNALVGTIPSSIGLLSDLTELRLPSNLLTGTIPMAIGNMTSLETLSININELTGSIPTSIGGLPRMRNLNGSWNRLTGTIPSEIGLLTDLVIFFVQRNKIAGSMPSTMASLTSLRQVDVSYNDLVDGAENLCDISTLVVYQSDCYKQLIPAIDREICCPCCSLCCNEFINGCQRLADLEC